MSNKTEELREILQELRDDIDRWIEGGYINAQSVANSVHGYYDDLQTIANQEQ
jgi:hypothetical protein